jgi:hypothetical protein
VAVKTAPKKKAAPLPEWKSPEAEAMMKRRTNAFLAKHGTSEAVADLQVLLTLSTKLTGYRRPAQMITAFRPVEAEEEAETEDTEEEEEETE